MQMSSGEAALAEGTVVTSCIRRPGVFFSSWRRLPVSNDWMKTGAERRFQSCESSVACCFFFSSRRRHTRFDCDWSSDVCSSDLRIPREYWAAAVESEGVIDVSWQRRVRNHGEENRCSITELSGRDNV